MHHMVCKCRAAWLACDNFRMEGKVVSHDQYALGYLISMKGFVRLIWRHSVSCLGLIFASMYVLLEDWMWTRCMKGLITGLEKMRDGSFMQLTCQLLCDYISVFPLQIP